MNVPADGPLATTDGLKPGDVLMVAVQLADKRTGDPYWWRSFRCVLEVHNRLMATTVLLKLQPDLDKDVRDLPFGTSDQRLVIEYLPEHRWPQGVVAMRMKHISLGLIKLDQ